MKDLPEGYCQSISERALDPKNIVGGSCFLCGGPPSTGKGEHIFPLWLQHKFDLFDKKLGLLNGSLIPYRQLTIPACEECNNITLSKTEAKISKILDQNPERLKLHQKWEVGRWMAKLFVGILFKEASLLMDRKNPDLGSIVPPEYLDELFHLHLLIQSWRKLSRFECLHSPHPFSLFTYRVDWDADFSDFDFSTNFSGQSVSIRLGNWGFVFVADGGLQHHAAELGPFDLEGEVLHPIQFEEITARIHLKSALRDATHLYFNAETPSNLTCSQVRVVPYTKTKLADGSDRVFRDWSDEKLATMLKRYRVRGADQLINEAGEACYTRLVDQQGEKILIPNIRD